VTGNGRRIVRAWLVTVGLSMIVVFVLAILMAEPDPATRDSSTTTSLGLGE
jgi:hypothetical protein